jgi:hypothetical protein
MSESLIDRIRELALSPTEQTRFRSLFAGRPIPPPVAEAVVNAAERALGFALPALLREYYTQIGNGGFGPGLGIIGLPGGWTSDYGSIVDIYELVKADSVPPGTDWQAGLLPFCEWGCNTYWCVDCIDNLNPVAVLEDGDALGQDYTLPQFFEMWLNGVDLYNYGDKVSRLRVGTDPKTGEPIIIKRRRRNRPG